MSTLVEQLAEAKQRQAEWRAKNVPTTTDEQRAAGNRLQAEVDALRTQIGRQLVTEIQAHIDGVVLSTDKDSVTCRLPKIALRQLLVAHEGGHDDDVHFGLAADDPADSATTFAVVLLLREALKG